MSCTRFTGPAGLEGSTSMADLGFSMDDLFQEEFVVDHALKDLSESLDDVSAVELAADLRSFLAEIKTLA